VVKEIVPQTEFIDDSCGLIVFALSDETFGVILSLLAALIAQECEEA